MLRLRDSLMVFKCTRGLAPPHLCSKMKTRDQVHDRNTKNKKSPEIPLCKSAQDSALFEIEHGIWNNLLDGLKESSLNTSQLLSMNLRTFSLYSDLRSLSRLIFFILFLFFFNYRCIYFVFCIYILSRIVFIELNTFYF